MISRSPASRTRHAAPPGWRALFPASSGKPAPLHDPRPPRSAWMPSQGFQRDLNPAVVRTPRFCPPDLPNASMPQGGGLLCWSDPAACTANAMGCQGGLGACQPEPGVCASGEAAGAQGYSFFCLADLPADALPAGSGMLCFASQAACENATNPCGGGSQRCALDTVACPTGMASAASPPHLWACPGSYPAGAQPNGFGAWCYTDSASCMSGPNACSESAPCQYDVTTCSSGVAGDLRNVPGAPLYGFFCKSDVPNGAVPTAAGGLCYDTIDNCIQGPNSCDGGAPCSASATICSTGPAAFSGNVMFCATDAPHGSIANGAGALCYVSEETCGNGPNYCDNVTNHCVASPAMCSTGEAAGAVPAHVWFCPLSVPPGALPMASGSYCYSSSLLCLEGTNACGVDFPCSQMHSTCASGMSVGTGNNWFCSRDIPEAALPNGGGLLCYSSIQACNLGANSCNSTHNPTAQCTLQLGICATGQAAAAGSQLVSLHTSVNGGDSAPVVMGFKYFCPNDLPPLALPAGSGVLCFATQAACHNALNPCSNANPCTLDFGVCSTGIAGSSSPPNLWACHASYPAGALAVGFGAWCVMPPGVGVSCFCFLAQAVPLPAQVLLVLCELHFGAKRLLSRGLWCNVQL